MQGFFRGYKVSCNAICVSVPIGIAMHSAAALCWTYSCDVNGEVDFREVVTHDAPEKINLLLYIKRRHKEYFGSRHLFCFFF